jgi:hypothetical protein
MPHSSIGGHVYSAAIVSVYSAIASAYSRCNFRVRRNYRIRRTGKAAITDARLLLRSHHDDRIFVPPLARSAPVGDACWVSMELRKTTSAEERDTLQTTESGRSLHTASVACAALPLTTVSPHGARRSLPTPPPTPRPATPAPHPWTIRAGVTVIWPIECAIRIYRSVVGIAVIAVPGRRRAATAAVPVSIPVPAASRCRFSTKCEHRRHRHQGDR